jgi:hypothetical protein
MMTGPTCLTGIGSIIKVISSSSASSTMGGNPDAANSRNLRQAA